MKGGVILGDWTHRRGGTGGTRAVSADVADARPAVTWSWRPHHGGRVDQVRIAGGYVYVATMSPADGHAPGWEHAVLYALDAKTGREVARRVLPDPVPVAAMAVEAGLVFVVATRRGEPVFWYVLGAPDLDARQRRLVEIDGANGASGGEGPRSLRRNDVLDVWAAPDGGIWLEIDGAAEAQGDDRAAEDHRAYLFVPKDAEPDGIVRLGAGASATEDANALARDACAAGRALFVPQAEGATLWRLEPGKPVAPWARADFGNGQAYVHTMCAAGLVHAFAIAEDIERPDRAWVQAFASDQSSGVERWKSHAARVMVRGTLGDAARLARRSNGELLFQRLRADGSPCTDLVCARPDGSLEIVVLGNGRKPRLDAALGDLVLAHYEGRDGRVVVYGFEIDRERLLLGRRGAARWTVETDDLGGGASVYAGAGHIVVRGAAGVTGIRV